MKHLISTYQQLLDLQDATFSRIEHEDAMVAVVYKITQTDGKQFILKICDRVNDFLREVHFLKFFADKLLVPQIIQVVQPDEHIHGAILMEYLSGSLLQPKELTEPLAYEIGRYLAIIHLNRLPGYGDPLKDNLSSDPRVNFRLKFEEGLNECKNQLPIRLVEKCRSYFESHLDLLMSVDGPCIVHRDFRPGNLIVHEGQVAGVIDWASTRASFAEEDFCSLEHGEWFINKGNKESFLAGYASIRKVPDYNSLIPFLRLNKAIATIGFTVKRGTFESINANLYKLNLRFLVTLFEQTD